MDTANTVIGDVEEVTGPLEGYDQAAFEAEPAYGEPIKVAFSGALCTSTTVFPEVLGYYEEEGIEIERVTGGNPIEQAGTGQIDLGASHIAASLVPAVNGTNIRFFETTQTGCQSLLVAANSDIKTTQDLANGGKIGLPGGIGGPDNNIVIRFLLRDGISLDDVKFVPIELSAASQALEKGELDACLMPDQYSRPFRQAGQLEVIRSITYDSDFTEEPCCVHFFNGGFVEENPIHAAKIENAIKRANHFINNNMEETAQILLDENLATTKYEVVLENLNEYHWVVSDDVLEETLIDIIEDYKLGGVLPEDTNTQDLMDTIFIPIN